MPRFIAKLAIPITVATLFGAAFLSAPPTVVSGQTTTQTATATGTGTATATATGTGTATATATGTGTATATATGTATGTATATATGTSTATPNTGTIISGSVPPVGFGLIVWGGGTRAQLVAAANCTAPTLSFWATSAGEFVTYVPGTQIAAVNAGFDALFGPVNIPANTPLVSRCTS
jgi:hypothetical protein